MTEIERRVDLLELAKKVTTIEKQLKSEHNAFHSMENAIAEQNIKIAVQAEQTAQVLQVTKEIKRGLWGEDGTGGMLGKIEEVKKTIDLDIKTIKERQDTLSGWLKGLGISVIVQIGATITTIISLLRK